MPGIYAGRIFLRVLLSLLPLLLSFSYADASEMEERELKYQFSIPSEKDADKGVYFKSIHSINIDRTGCMYVLDWKLSIVSKFDPSGNHICNIGRSGQGPGEFLSPQHICFDENGNLILYEYGNGRIQILDPTGMYLSSIKTLKFIHEIVYFNGYLYTINVSADPKPDLIDVIDMKGNRAFSFGREETE